ncbi:MAG TPA: hypothetical protein DIV86_05445 [Alphaproteobacteria bacterium]|nr:hypothetical protein [Alphaproteobacteria bacterium]
MRFTFNLIHFKHRKVKDRENSGYKVYKSKKDYVVVTAKTAAEALATSAVEKPQKIERVGIIKKSLFTEGEVT